jgi:hypothetical protein
MSASLAKRSFLARFAGIAALYRRIIAGNIAGEKLPQRQLAASWPSAHLRPQHGSIMRRSLMPRLAICRWPRPRAGATLCFLGLLAAAKRNHRRISGAVMAWRRGGVAAAKSRRRLPASQSGWRIHAAHQYNRAILASGISKANNQCASIGWRRQLMRKAAARWRSWQWRRSAWRGASASLAGALAAAMALGIRNL